MEKLLPYLTTAALGLVVIAIYLYPGGSSLDQNQSGYSLLHNYWCDLLDATAYNGQINNGRYFAMAAGILACIALYLVMAELGHFYGANALQKSMAKVAAALSMVAASLLFSPWHNFFVALLIGNLLIYFWLMVVPVWRHTQVAGRLITLITFISLVMTAFIYYTQWSLNTLPWVQKISFLLLLVLLYHLHRRIPASQ